MSVSLERAVQLYNEASRAVEEDNFDRAEVLFMESREIFLQMGGAYALDVANIMNRIASMKEKYGDHGGALHAAHSTIRSLDGHFEGAAGIRAEEMRSQAREIIERVEWFTGKSNEV